MKAPLIARVLGIAFVLAAALGFVPFITAPAPLTAEYIQLTMFYGFLAGLFPVNLVHDALHAILGIWGIIASFKFAKAVNYCRWLAVIYLLLAFLGMIPITNTLFGAVPIYGHDVWLHLIVAILAAYGGFGAGRLEPKPDL